jgi:hypothetical protein
MAALLKVYAKMCEAVYYIPRIPIQNNEEIRSHLPENWLLVDMFEPKGGFGTFFAIFVNKDLKEVVLAIRGTDNFYNQIDDAMLVCGRMTDNRNEPLGQRHVEEAAQYVYTGSIFGACRDAMEELAEIREVVNYSFIKLLLLALGIIMGPAVAPLTFLLTSYYGYKTAQSIIKRWNDRDHPLRLIQLGQTIADKYPGYELKIVGHSLGGCMAILCATAINCSGILSMIQ